ncbi:hypothetical protein TNCV_4750431 [Trichonephila clavipes]|nr:hypothetical protein TNCV_4750431 [Trichonephila clavipes]
MRVLYRQRQNERLRLLFGASLYRYVTATYPHASDSANRRTNDTIFVASMSVKGEMFPLEADGRPTGSDDTRFYPAQSRYHHNSSAVNVVNSGPFWLTPFQS